MRRIKSAENDGIVFIDEIDEICARSEHRGGANVSREGVQRDLLPLIEGTTVTPPSTARSRPTTADLVRERVGKLAKSADLSKFIL